MKPWVCWIFVALLSAHGLEAQGTVVHPEPPLDSARTELRDALLGLRDSLNSIDAAAARLQRDYRQASAPLLLSRARVMHEACSRSARTLPAARQVLSGANVFGEGRVKRRGELTQAMKQLQGVLSRCESEFAAMSQAGQAETVRGYGNDRAIQVQGAIRKYEKSLGEFFGAMGIKATSPGADAKPSAG